jgi:transcriptional regulator with XRE-family HTH domain
MARRLKQSDLAQRCGISASYLNLIEHNRRRIGGRLLVRLARVLDVEPSVLSEGADRSRLAALQDAATESPAAQAEPDLAEEFLRRYPGWAALVIDQRQRIEILERTAALLNDRLTHDPFLSASMHDVLSTVTSIRSSSAILAGSEQVDPEWQARFHRNIYEDSQRLTEASRALVAHLDAAGDVERGSSLPQEELERWLTENDFRFPALEIDPDADLDPILATDLLGSLAAQSLARNHLRRYAADVRALPEGQLLSTLDTVGLDPAAIAAATGADLAVILRRLIAMPAVARLGPLGLVGCDGTGTLTLRKPIDGLAPPVFGAACAMLPLFEALQRPGTPIHRILEAPGQPMIRLETFTIAVSRYPGGFNAPPVVEAWTLAHPAGEAHGAAPAIPIGPSCRVCTQPRCPARREPSIFGSGLEASSD